MKSKQHRASLQTPKAIVVDASVARAAGMTDHPVSMACRVFLETFESQTSHTVVMSQEIRYEWDRHKSRLSSRWLASMHSSRRVIHIETNKDRELWAAFGDAPLSSSAYANLHKDLLLIEAASQTDRRVTSNDEIVRCIFRTCVEIRQEFGEIAWVNPTKEAEEPIAWLLSGAPREPARLLRHHITQDAPDNG